VAIFDRFNRMRSGKRKPAKCPVQVLPRCWFEPHSPPYAARCRQIRAASARFGRSVGQGRRPTSLSDPPVMETGWYLFDCTPHHRQPSRRHPSGVWSCSLWGEWNWPCANG